MSNISNKSKIKNKKNKNQKRHKQNVQKIVSNPNSKKQKVNMFAIANYKVENFNINKFLSKHQSESNLFVSGSQYADTEDGKYECLLVSGPQRIGIVNNVMRSISANDTMLQGILHIIKNQIQNNTKLNVIIYTKLGFEHPKQSKNRQLVETIYNESCRKNLSLMIHLVDKGTTKLRPFIIENL